jgi:hypothetical protein
MNHGNQEESINQEVCLLWLEEAGGSCFVMKMEFLVS